MALVCAKLQQNPAFSGAKNLPVVNHRTFCYPALNVKADWDTPQDSRVVVALASTLPSSRIPQLKDQDGELDSRAAMSLFSRENLATREFTYFTTNSK